MANMIFKYLLYASRAYNVFYYIIVQILLWRFLTLMNNVISVVWLQYLCLVFAIIVPVPARAEINLLIKIQLSA